jgi:hypothetical protein
MDGRMMIFRTDTWTLEGLRADLQQELEPFEVAITDDLPYRTWHVPDSQWSYFILKYPEVQQIDRNHEIDLGEYRMVSNCWVEIQQVDLEHHDV